MMSDTTLYWIIGIAAVTLLGFTHMMVGIACYFAAKRPGAIPHEDVIMGTKCYVDPDSLKPAGTVGFMLVKRRYGPYGLLSKWETIPEAYIVRDNGGKPLKLYSPKDKYVEKVLGNVEVEVGELTKAQMTAEEWKTRYAEEKVRNDASIDVQVDKHVKRLGEAVPYVSLNNKNKSRGGQGGYK